MIKSYSFKWFYYDWVDYYVMENVGNLLAKGEYMITDYCSFNDAEDEFLNAVYIELETLFHDFNSDNFCWEHNYP